MDTDYIAPQIDPLGFNSVQAMVWQEDILIGGPFASVDGIPRKSLVRLLGGNRVFVDGFDGN